MNAVLANGVLRYVQVSSALGKRALDEVTKSRQAAKAAAAYVPNLTQQMLDTGAIKTSQKTACEHMLANHADSLQLLSGALEKLAEAKAEITKLKTAGASGDRLGSPDKSGSTKSAGHNGLPAGTRSVIVGARTSEKKGSDNALARGLGLTQLVDANADEA